MSPEEDRRLYLQHMFTALRHYCQAVTGKVHVFTYPVFFEKYEVLKRHVRDYNGFKLVRLDLSDAALNSLEFYEDGIFFTAQFNGVSNEFYLPFDHMLGLTNCRDQVVHRLSIAATAQLQQGIDYMVMMDYSTGQLGNQMYQEPAATVPHDAPVKPEVKRPSLSIVK